jgi:plastocyanin
MTRKHFAVAIIAAALVAALASAGAALSGSTSTRTLKAVVGPGYTISLKMNGKTVKRLKAGKYKIVVTDKSNFHNVTLEREKPSKPKLEKDLTSVAFVGTKTVTWTLKPGSWRAYCSIHEALMHHDFKVTR